MSLPKSNREGYSTSRTDVKRLSFLKLSEGQHFIRMLTPISEVEIKYSHWVRNSSIKCLGAEACPICVSNRQILDDNENDWSAILWSRNKFGP